MYSFNNDYSECAHPNILKAIADLGFEQNTGYGLDKHCENTREILKKEIKKEEVDIHFLPGGTITNATMISHALKPFEAVIAASTGHINVHETGAIEATGHKVIDMPCADGKLTVKEIQTALDIHEDEHMVLPKMVYVSNPTEIGTVYTKQELEVLYDFCKKNNLYLYLDGARLAMALAVEEAGLKLEDLPNVTDAFYIGGTKIGALFGEALVIVNDSLKDNFRFSIKQKGAMTAKGWLLGVQFCELFKDGLYYEMGKHANDMAKLLKDTMQKAGFSFDSDSPTNQLFPIFPNELIEKINENYITSLWRKVDENHSSIRFCTSWATKEEDVRKFIEYFENLIAE